MDSHLHEMDFLQGGGEMGRLMRALDWGDTPLGAPQSWPQSLRVTVRLMLNTRHPMFIFWGPDLIQLYNDAYRRVIGPEKHPSALGRAARETWPEIWDVIGPQIEQVMDGLGSIWQEDRLIPIVRHGALREVWWTYSYSPIDHDGGIGGVLVVCQDVTEQHRTREALQDQFRRMTALLEQAPGFMAVLSGPRHVFEMTNAAYRRLTGDRAVIGRSVAEVLPETGAQGFLELLDRVYASGEAYVGRRVPLVLDGPQGEPPRRSFLDFVYQPIRDAEGAVTGIFVEGHDVTEHVEAEAHLRLMNQELRHRGKNLLGMVSAIATQTLRGVPQLGDFHRRLQTFDTANDIITEETRTAAAVPALLRAVLKPYGVETGRIALSGPPTVIGARHALTLSLAAHELAVNATKYGALSNEGGRVAVDWSAAGGRFRFAWRERGGPPVAPPTRTGFGSTILRSVLARDFGGEVTIRHDPEGLTCTLDAPLDAIRRAAEG